MDRAERTRRHAAGRAFEAEARVEKAAYDRARREATRLGVAGGTSALSGAGGGGTEALDPLLNHDDEMADVSAVASPLLRSSRNPDVDDRRRAASANRSARMAAAAVRGAPRANLDPYYRGRLRLKRAPTAPVGPSPVVHTGLSVDSALPSSTPSSVTIRYRLPVVPPWGRHCSFFTPTPAASGTSLAPAADTAMPAATFPVPPPPPLADDIDIMQVDSPSSSSTSQSSDAQLHSANDADSVIMGSSLIALSNSTTEPIIITKRPHIDVGGGGNRSIASGAGQSSVYSRRRSASSPPAPSAYLLGLSYIPISTLPPPTLPFLVKHQSE